MEGWRFVNWQEKEHQQAKLAELRGSRESGYQVNEQKKRAG